ncbi:MAG: OB-fold nucleic acid binding domain-containing protein [Desulfomonilia bacterium]|nr:OB-fold nucleic acid binding domain-containing protein [Desulfomonilia bacterium]
MISKGRLVSEIGDGDRIKAVFLVSERRLLMTRNGKHYAKFLLTDKTGDIPGIMWDDAEQQISGIEPGDVVGVKASAESYENRLQLRIEKILRLSDNDVDVSSLIPTVNRDIAGMMQELEGIMAAVGNRHLKRLLENVFSREGVREQFMKAPAAKGIHHNYIGGLLEHTLQVVRAIDVLLPLYVTVGLNRDLLVTGAVLHDLGKIYEYSYSRIIEMTPQGRLLGHIYLSAHITDSEISSIPDFPDELKLQLLHLILGHHGQLEFGSPKLPMTREAMFLHMLDDLDAKLIGFTSIIDATPEEEVFSSFSSVYNRYLYTKTYEEEE